MTVDTRSHSPARASCSPTSSHSRSAVLDQLNAEWAAISDTPEARGHVRRWRDATATLAGCVCLEDVRRRIWSASEGDQDHILGLLLRAGADGDQLAYRTVFQTFLGAAIKRGFTPTRQALQTPEEVGQDIATALWDAIASYPLDRRPAKIPANLVMETVQRLWATRPQSLPVEIPTSTECRALSDVLSVANGYAVASRSVLGVSPLEWACSKARSDASSRWASFAALDAGASTSAVGELLEVLAWGVDVGAITSDQAALLIRVYCPPPGTVGGRAVAGELGMSWAAVRQRCSRAVRSLAAAVTDRVAVDEISFGS